MQAPMHWRTERGPRGRTAAGKMAVFSERQGKVVAGALLKSVKTELRSKQCKRIILDTTEPLRGAVRSNEKHGFTPSGLSIRLVWHAAIVKPL